MSDGDALRRAIIEHPGEDTPRLAYADWLDEHGAGARHGLADLIRWQIETGVSFWRDFDAGRWRNKAKRGVRMLPSQCWFALNSHLSDPWPGPFTVRRGFVDEVRCTLAAWESHGPAIVATHPVTVVRLTDKRPDASVQHPGWFRWYSHVGAGGANDLPECVYELLVGEYPESRSGRALQPYWRTEQAAIDALSAAAIALAKSPA